MLAQLPDWLLWILAAAAVTAAVFVLMALLPGRRPETDQEYLDRQW